MHTSHVSSDAARHKDWQYEKRHCGPNAVYNNNDTLIPQLSMEKERYLVTVNLQQRSAYWAPKRSMIGTDPGIDLKANKEAMAIIAARPFLKSHKQEGIQFKS